MKKQITLSLLLFTSLVARAEGPDGEKGVTIYFTNDIHTHVDNDSANGGIRYSHVAQLKKDCEGAVFLVDAGDYLQGTAYGLLDCGKRIVGLMNAAGFFFIGVKEAPGVTPSNLKEPPTTIDVPH